MCRRNFQLSSVFILVGLFAVGCAGVNYVGNLFNPTTTVDVYFSKEEIETDYTVMRHALGTGTWVSNDKIQKKLIEEAQNRGADAILTTGLGESHIPIGGGEDGSVSHVKQDQINVSFLKHQ